MTKFRRGQEDQSLTQTKGPSVVHSSETGLARGVNNKVQLTEKDNV
jgi:hypothetical protein